MNGKPQRYDIKVEAAVTLSVAGRSFSVTLKGANEMCVMAPGPEEAIRSALSSVAGSLLEGAVYLDRADKKRRGFS